MDGFRVGGLYYCTSVEYLPYRSVFQVVRIVGGVHFFRVLATNNKYEGEEGVFKKITDSLRVEEISVDDLPLYVGLPFIKLAFREVFEGRVYG